MAFSAGGASDAFSDFGTAIGDFYAASGDRKSAQSYLQAADIANQNTTLEQMSTAIQEGATQRQVNKTIGGQQAQVGGAGLAESGSAIDLMKDSAQQGSIQKALLGVQGTINANAYRAQAGAYMGEYQAAESAAKAADAGGIMSTIGGVVSIAAMFSDARLKDDIAFARIDRGFNIYTFRYRGHPSVYEGVLAQEVLARRPDAVIEDASGFLKVDYAALGLEMRRLR